MTIRFTDEVGDTLEAVAQVDETPMVEIVRQVVEKYLAERRAQPDYKAKLAAYVKRVKG
jgi:predicted transcriptional regulator